MNAGLKNKKGTIALLPLQSVVFCSWGGRSFALFLTKRWADHLVPPGRSCLQDVHPQVMWRMSYHSPVSSNTLPKEKDNFRSLNLILPHLSGTTVRELYSLGSEMMSPTLRKTNSLGLFMLSVSQASYTDGLFFLLLRMPTWTM